MARIREERRETGEILTGSRSGGVTGFREAGAGIRGAGREEGAVQSP
jgi:hypothetical protein